MQIHYYMQYFPGPNSAGSRQPYTLARFLAARGHDVTVVASRSNIDTGKREPATTERDSSGGSLRVLRLPCLSGGRGNNQKRLAAYLSFMAIAALRGASLPAPNVVLGSIQPMFTGLAAKFAAGFRKAPFVLEVRDLWPDALVVKNAISHAQARPLFRITQHLYSSSNRIVSITPGIKRELLKKGIPASKIDVFPNGFDPQLFAGSDNRREEVRQKYGWSKSFLAIYTGSFTKVTAVDVLVRAAARLKNNPEIRFALFGNGPTRETVGKIANELGACNVTFYDPVPKKEVPGLLAGADIALMSLFETPLAHIYFENKFLDYMGAGKAIMAAMKGEQADMIGRHAAGTVVPPGDDEGLAESIARASQDRNCTFKMGARGRECVHNDLLLPDILARYALVLEAIGNREQNIACWEPAI